MTHEASALLAAALKTATLGGSFAPADVGARVGLNKFQSQTTARDLSNAGVLVLGFDGAAEFSPKCRKAHAPAPKGRKR
jgi:hypothetical protein